MTFNKIYVLFLYKDSFMSLENSNGFFVPADFAENAEIMRLFLRKSAISAGH